MTSQFRDKSRKDEKLSEFYYLNFDTFMVDAKYGDFLRLLLSKPVQNIQNIERIDTQLLLNVLEDVPNVFKCMKNF